MMMLVPVHAGVVGAPQPKGARARRCHVLVVGSYTLASPGIIGPARPTLRDQSALPVHADEKWPAGTLFAVIASGGSRFPVPVSGSYHALTSGSGPGPFAPGMC